MASGSRSAMIAAARPMAPMVPRAEGSTITDAWGTWAATARAWAAPVTTEICGVSSSSLSTVCWRRLRPAPVRSARNFGAFLRESGHSRLPAPPAGTIA